MANRAISCLAQPARKKTCVAVVAGLSKPSQSFRRCSFVLSTMEVASPLSFVPMTAGSKRSLAFSPQSLNNTPNHGKTMAMEESMERSIKRRRFAADTSVESLSEHFSSHSPFFAQSKKSIFTSAGGMYRRLRPRCPLPSSSSIFDSFCVKFHCEMSLRHQIP